MEFQFLLGTLKTLLEKKHWLTSIGVSIPFRYAENSCAVMTRFILAIVSISFRYAENVYFEKI